MLHSSCYQVCNLMPFFFFSRDLFLPFGVERQLLAKELVMSRNAKNRMFEGKAQLHSVQMQLQNQIGESTGSHVHRAPLRAAEQVF